MSEKLNVLKFRAENFEAEVTEVTTEGGWNCVVTVQGNRPTTLRRRPSAGFFHEMQLLTRDRGWVEVTNFMNDKDTKKAIAEAIALLYSVPGVEYVDPDELKPTLGFCPECGAMGVSRELGPDGNDECKRGHRYPSSAAVPA